MLKYLPIYLLIALQFTSTTVFSQRTFVNPAVTDPGPCACDVQVNACDPNCCCDPDCSTADLSVSPVCNSVRTVTSYSSSEDSSLQTWNCSNTTSSALYDYFPFVCVQFELNEVLGNYYLTDNITFLKTASNLGSLRSTFVTEYPALFQSTLLTTPTTTTTGNYTIGAPVRLSTGTSFLLPANLVGLGCQNSANVLFGINRDFTCSYSSSLSSLCSSVSSATTFLQGGGLSSTVNAQLYTSNYTTTSATSRNLTTPYFFQDAYTQSIANIPYTNGTISDYCVGYHPLTRTQRYSTACASSDTGSCTNSYYQTWNGCQERDSLQYTAIPTTFFTARIASTDDPTNFIDFNSRTNVPSISCAAISLVRVFYRFNYSSSSNSISTVEVFVLTSSSSSTPNPRITIEWNDVAINSASSTTIPRSYTDGENLQFRRNGVSSDVSSLVPTSSGLCIDANRVNLRYKRSISSYCFLQLTQSTVQQCHDLKLNMYLYLNAFYAPASDVLAYPSGNATLIPIRDTNQDQLDLDGIDETRPNNRLNTTYITQSKTNTQTYTIYDTTQYLPVCYGVPSGIYIEFDYVRVSISPTVSYERIVSVKYNYTYSNWQFDCTTITCNSASTQRYLVSFRANWVDYTDLALGSSQVTKSDLTSADNYIQHLLWLITPEYQGEPGYRKYTIAMILIFIAISVVVLHVLLFGIMFPF